MSDEEYDKLNNSVRAYKREKFRTDPEYRRQVIEAQQKRDNARREELEAASKIDLGARCKIISRN